ncbi:MAG: helix-turn-helix domain-containing protein [Acidobacteriia bacterium]|nr:helix-turn-helix domain-containing protein [Terriglobia bacterium]
MAREMLTTKEVAEYLSINEKQVYRLIKERKIPASRITGKWLFPKQLVDEWVMDSARENVGARLQPRPSDNQVVIAGSNDLALELLTKNVNLQFPIYTISMSNIGSLGGLVALQRGSCQIAASHLLDVQTGDYNIPIIKEHFSDLDVKVLNLCYREQGLIVKSNNPLGIQGLGDLASKKAILVNRQEGSGSRVLFDYKLKQKGIDPAAIQGYAKIACTHMEVALDVFSGSADVGIGILAAAKMLGLGFVPLATERFDLIVPAGNFSTGAVKALRQVLGSEKFKLDVAQMEGYDTRDTGKILYESH